MVTITAGGVGYTSPSPITLNQDRANMSDQVSDTEVPGRRGSGVRSARTRSRSTASSPYRSPSAATQRPSRRRVSTRHRSWRCSSWPRLQFPPYRLKGALRGNGQELQINGFDGIKDILARSNGEVRLQMELSLIHI